MRPGFIGGAIAAGCLLVLFAAGRTLLPSNAPPFADYQDIAPRAGLTAKTIIGEENEKPFLLESTGGGVVLLDYDNDGWLDIFLVNGSRRAGFPPGQEPINHLYRNRQDGTFEDVTQRAGLARSGWGQGACAGDYNRDGYLDLYVTYYGYNVLYRNNRDGTFREATREAGLEEKEKQYNTGCSWVDYDRDGNLDLIVARYASYDDGLRDLPNADRVCRWKGMRVFCGPRGMTRSRPVLYRNRGDGTFIDVTEQTGVARVPPGYGFTPIAADFDNDGWPDIYISNDAASSLLLRNNGDGTFAEIGMQSYTALSDSGMEQAGMGVDAGDYDGDGLLDIVKTNFSNDIPNLYHNLGKNIFFDEALGSGLHVNPHYLGWGVAFADLDADSWADIVIANGHVYPGIEKVEHGATYRQKKQVFRNLRNGTFQNVTENSGSGMTLEQPARGMAKGDLFNTGQIDFVVNNMWNTPTLLRNMRPPENHRIEIRLIGVQTNPHGIGSRVHVLTGQRTQFDEVRAGASFCSQNDLRLFFGLAGAARVNRIEVEWLGGKTEQFKDVEGDQLIVIRQGAGIVERKAFAHR